MTATLRLITEQEFRTSRYAQVADQIEGRITDVIAQAEDHVERYLDRRLTVQQYVEYIRPAGDSLFVRNRPIVAVSQVRRRFYYTDPWYVMDLARFEVFKPQGYVRSLERNINNGYEVEVTYTAGYEVIPNDIKAAVILQTVIFAYQDLEVYGAGDAKKPGIVYLQDQVEQYLKPYQQLRMTVP